MFVIDLTSIDIELSHCAGAQCETVCFLLWTTITSHTNMFDSDWKLIFSVTLWHLYEFGDVYKFPYLLTYLLRYIYHTSVPSHETASIATINSCHSWFECATTLSRLQGAECQTNQRRKAEYILEAPLPRRAQRVRRALWHFSEENLLMANQPLLRNWPRKLPNLAK